MAERSEFHARCECGRDIRSHERLYECECGRTLDFRYWADPDYHPEEDTEPVAVG